MKIVYIVERGEDGEGSTILGVFASSKGAARFAEAVALTMPFKMTSVEPDAPIVALWRGGCDYLQVSWYDVLR